MAPQDRLKPIVKMLSWMPSIILLVLTLSFLLYLAMPFIRSIQLGIHDTIINYTVRLISVVYHSYFPSHLVFNTACLVLLMIFLACMLSPLWVGYSAATVYVTGIILYFLGVIMSGIFSGIMGFEQIITRGEVEPAFLMPSYGFGIGDLFLAGLLFLLSMSGKTVSLIWRWVSSQAPALIAVIIAVNVLGLLSMWLDKKQSMTPEAYRIPERSLLKYSVLCGGAGIIAGAYIFKHKTRHRGLITSVIIASIAGSFILLGGLIM